MNILKKIITALAGLLLMGCTISANEKIDNHYVCEAQFKGEYNEALKDIKNGLYGKALTLLNKLEKEDYAPALYSLYELYYNANGVKRDKQRALDYLTKSYVQQYPIAEYEMAKKMLKGEEVEQNIIEAMNILKDLAERDYEDSGEDHIFYRLKAKANVMLARVYYEGKYVKQDLKQAGEYGYVIGSLPPTQEYNIGRELLGEAYFLYGKIMIAQAKAGLEVRWNRTVAFGHAQEMGVIEVDYEEGLLYLEENNVKYAASSFGMGCSSGHAKSCYEAGVLYEKERVYKKGDKNEYGHVQDDPVIVATRYYEHGAKLGNNKCKERLKILKNPK